MFTSASIPFTLKPSYHLKSFQLHRKRKRTVSKINEENTASPIKRQKLEDNDINSNTKRMLVEHATSNDDKTMGERISSNNVLAQPEALDVSECYATAVESFDDGHSAVFNSPEGNFSKKIQPKLWRKRKRYHDTDRISKKKLKMNSDKIFEKSETKSNTKKGVLKFCNVLIYVFTIYVAHKNKGKMKRYFSMR